MLYHLLYPLHQIFSFFNVFRYITFRTIYSILTALLISFILGTWLIQKLRAYQIQQVIRQAEHRIPDHKLVVMENPFGGWADTERVVLVPAIRPDVTLIHVQQAAAVGTTRIAGLTFADVEQAKAAQHVVLTCEDLVASAELRSHPEHNQIPAIIVDAVVPVRYGAYPTACYRYYDYDPQFLSDYRTAATDDARFAAYLEQWVFGKKDHAERMAQVGAGRLASIQL